MSKSSFNTTLAANIKDNNNKFITPARHRTVLEALRDFIGWLAEVNIWTAVNSFTAGTRKPFADITGTGTVTISSTKDDQLIKSGVTQVNFPSSKTDGDRYRLKNVSGAQVTLSGNGSNLYTWQSVSTATINNSVTQEYIYHASDDLWYNVQ